MRSGLVVLPELDVSMWRQVLGEADFLQIGGFVAAIMQLPLANVFSCEDSSSNNNSEPPRKSLRS